MYIRGFVSRRGLTIHRPLAATFSPLLATMCSNQFVYTVCLTPVIMKEPARHVFLPPNQLTPLPTKSISLA
jgi:hypothetical protein